MRKEEKPLAYLVTFTCYGTHLHGDPRGSVSRWKNRWTEDPVPECPALLRLRSSGTKQSIYLLDPVRRRLVKEGILDGCRRRQWRVLALQVRVTHAHVVVRATGQPRRIRDGLKAFASRGLNEAGLDRPSRVRWTRGGSVDHLFTRKAVDRAIDYVLNRQGPQMEVYCDPTWEAEED